MHLAYSLGYFFITMVLTAGYVLAGGVTVLAILRIFSWLGKRKAKQLGKQGHGNEQIGLESPFGISFGTFRRKKAGAVFAAFFLIYHVAFYSQQRREWMGHDNAHLAAKEYFVAGQVLYGFRTILTRFLHPENVFIEPLNKLQQRIYQRGVEFLPVEDGERYVWKQLWFLYPYTRTLRETRDGHPRRYSPDMVKLLDDCWECLEGMATKSFADRQMEQEQYYRNFSSLAFYYNLHRSQYFRDTGGANRVMAQDSMHVERTRLLITWLEKLEKKWAATPSMTKILEKHPLIAVARQESLMVSLWHALETVILQKQFRCDHPYVMLYVKTRNEFVGSREKPSSLIRLRSTKQRENHYDAHINAVGARFYKRILPRYCGYEVAGEEEFTKFQPPIEWDEDINYLFKREIQLIEERLHE